MSQSSWRQTSNYLLAAMFDANVIIWPFFSSESAEDRRRYVRRVFLEFAAFVVVGLVQWVLMLTLLKDWCFDLVRYHTSALLLGFVVGIFLFMIFALSKPLRRMKCFNWIMVVVIVEFLVISLSVLLAPTTVLHMLAGFLLVSLIFVFGTLLGALMPLDITSGGLYLYLMTMGIYMLSLYSLVLYSVLGVTWAFYVFAVSMACVVLVFLLYHVQCIMGGRTASTKLYDDKYAALLLFFEFVGFFILTLYWRPIMERLQLK